MVLLVLLVLLIVVQDCGCGGLVEGALVGAAGSLGCAVDPRLDLDLDLRLEVEVEVEYGRVKGEKSVHRRFWWRGALLEGEDIEGCCKEEDGGGGGKEGEGVGDALARGEVDREEDDRWMCRRRIRIVARRVSRV